MKGSSGKQGSEKQSSIKEKREEKKLSLLKKGIILVVGNAILALLSIKAFFTNRPVKLKNFTTAKLFKWIKVTLEEKAVDSSGGQYFMLARKGSANNLMIFFSGGGAAWDANTALQPMGLANILKGKGFGYYFGKHDFFLMSLFGGVLDHKNEKNPFRDWNIAYIPYTTADFHTGNAVVEYELDGERCKMRYNGRNNTQACLDWIFENFRNPRKVLICGESAGAFGSAFWTPKIAAGYSESELYQFSDGAYLQSDRWPDIVDQVWKAEWKKTFGYSIGNDPIRDAFINNFKQLGGKVTFMHSNTLYDGVLSAFQGDLNGKGTKDEIEKNYEFDSKPVEEWSQGMLESMDGIRRTVPNYYYYITNFERDVKKHITTHTLMRYDKFFTFEEAGVPFRSWMEDIILKGGRYSVGTGYLEAGGYHECKKSTL